MKKKDDPALETDRAAADDPLTLAPIVPLRTETVLTRFPFHQIAKKGKLAIRQITQTGRGAVATTWEVRHAPGALGYKIDALIINRRIDELRNKGELRPLIKIGSLREICEELGLNPNSGQNTNAVKESLRDNAFAGITCKLDFKDNEGKQRDFEFNDTRYGVYFIGDTLPNGRKADAVYIRLHEDYYTLLHYAKTRPLDYAYAKTLAPAPHRLYELLSFALFGALKYDQPTAQMLYSEFCRDAPLTRHYDSRKMHAQMWKIHQPHIKNGYFEKVTVEKTVDAKGQPDWVLKYTPGPRARREHALFTKKQFAQQEQAVPRLVPAPQAAPKPAAPPPLSAAEQALVEQLTAYKITAGKARKLVQKHRTAVERELQAFPQRDQSGIKSAAAWLVRAIESGDYSAPTKPAAARAKPQPATPQQQEQAEQARAAAEREQETRDRRNACELAAQKRYQELSPAELQQRQAQAEAAYPAAQAAHFRSEGIWDTVLRTLVVEQLTAELAASGQPPKAES